ncbi:hypothetical protein WJX81_004811 [Elliptochloris bilobata]|uniref:Uncharacterized protein n=1 Tax=Elliptochloris bilobata TaxID=381761 RepID=A0AAW1QNJ2_9CHLO
MIVEATFSRTGTPKLVLALVQRLLELDAAEQGERAAHQASFEAMAAAVREQATTVREQRALLEAALHAGLAPLMPASGGAAAGAADAPDSLQQRAWAAQQVLEGADGNVLQRMWGATAQEVLEAGDSLCEELFAQEFV